MHNILINLTILFSYFLTLLVMNRFTKLFYSQDCINKPQMLKFLIRHQNIKHLSLYSLFTEIITDEIRFSFVNTLKSLKTLIWNGEMCSLSKSYSENPLSRNPKEIIDCTRPRPRNKMKNKLNKRKFKYLF